MSEIRVNAVKNTGGVEKYLAQAWVNFNGTGTVAIRAAGNVSSITDEGIGQYRVNFTTAMSDTNYAAVCVGNGDALGDYGYVGSMTNRTTTAFSFTTRDASVNVVDRAQNNIVVFR